MSPRDLVDALERTVTPFKVVVMPDFFLDHFLFYGAPAEVFGRDTLRVAGHGGGNIPFKRASLLRGGNAANTASAIARLGGRVRLILRTDPLGMVLLTHFLKGVDLLGVKTDGRIASTIAIEVESGGRLVNIMVNDSGSVVDFGFDSLTRDDLEAVRDADFVCVFNWCQNLRGTELLIELLSRLKDSTVKTFFDSGDPSSRLNDVTQLMERVSASRRLDIFSMNENEAVWFATHFKPDVVRRKGLMKPSLLALECASLLHERLKTRIDLHTTDYSASFMRGERFVVPSFEVSALRATGAGDAWNAGDIVGDALGLPPTERLTLANAVAAFYISNPVGEHPTRDQVATLVMKRKRKELPPLPT